MLGKKKNEKNGCSNMITHVIKFMLLPLCNYMKENRLLQLLRYTCAITQGKTEVDTHV